VAVDLFGRKEVATQPPDAAPTGERRARDAYYTPDLLALACCQSLRRLGVNPQNILEPGCGGGAFLRAFEQVWPDTRTLGVDIAPACNGPGEVRTLDLFSSAMPRPFEAVIGNPPFDLAEGFVRRALDLVEPPGFVAFLLRITFLAGQGRVALYRKFPLWAFRPIAGRPSFTGTGSDPSEYGLFVWRVGHRGDGLILPPLEWKGGIRS
jgi:hypothetical protein